MKSLTKKKINNNSNNRYLISDCTSVFFCHRKSSMRREGSRNVATDNLPAKDGAYIFVYFTFIQRPASHPWLHLVTSFTHAGHQMKYKKLVSNRYRYKN